MGYNYTTNILTVCICIYDISISNTICMVVSCERENEAIVFSVWCTSFYCKFGTLVLLCCFIIFIYFFLCFNCNRAQMWIYEFFHLFFDGFTLNDKKKIKICDAKRRIYWMCIYVYSLSNAIYNTCKYIYIFRM